MSNLSDLLALVNLQAEDVTLWSIPSSDLEQSLQDALRTLHQAIEQAAGVPDGVGE